MNELEIDDMYLAICFMSSVSSSTFITMSAEYLQKSPRLLNDVSAYRRLIASSSMSFTLKVIRCLRTSLGSVSCGGDSPSLVSGGSVKSTSPDFLNIDIVSPFCISVGCADLSGVLGEFSPNKPYVVYDFS